MEFLHDTLDSIDKISHKISDQEYKEIVDNLHKWFNFNHNICGEHPSIFGDSDDMVAGLEDPADLFVPGFIDEPDFNFPELTVHDARILADTRWIDEFIVEGTAYGIRNGNGGGGERIYIFEGYSSSGRSVSFKNSRTQRIHSFLLGSHVAMWDKILT